MPRRLSASCDRCSSLIRDFVNQNCRNGAVLVERQATRGALPLQLKAGEPSERRAGSLPEGSKLSVRRFTPEELEMFVRHPARRTDDDDEVMMTYLIELDGLGNRSFN